jgi:hypothetical protein
MSVELFEAVSNSSTRKQLVIFIEIFSVLSGARQASIVNLPPENIERIKQLLKPFGLYAVRYRGSSNYIIVSNTFRHPEKIAFLRDSSELTPDVHRITGEVLGYMTPFDIAHPPEGPKQNAELQVFVSMNGKDYEIQIAPQIIIDKSLEDIQIYFGRMGNKLKELNEYELPFKITSFTTHVSERKGGTRKRRYRSKRKYSRALRK